jgi:hypothetical protein
MFKPGDKVRCVREFHSVFGASGSSSQLVGDVFTVECVTEGGSLMFKETGPCRWEPSRFELVEREQGIAFRVRKIVEASCDNGKTWTPVPAPEDL